MNTAVSHPEASHSGLHITAAPFRDWVRRAGLRLGPWVEAYADAAEATALFEHLSRLSDAELQRRGLSRSTLARDVSGVLGGS
jgi:hypothetical protein